jgi:hypothetical protein
MRQKDVEIAALKTQLKSANELVRKKSCGGGVSNTTTHEKEEEEEEDQEEASRQITRDCVALQYPFRQTRHMACSYKSA